MRLFGTLPLVVAGLFTPCLSSAFPSSKEQNAAAAFLDRLLIDTRGLGDALQRQPSSLVVDLGYAKYEGYNNATSGLNIWKG